jgi:hypothetical protein
MKPLAQVWQSSVVSFRKEEVIVQQLWIRHMHLAHGCLFRVEPAPIHVHCWDPPTISYLLMVYSFYAQEYHTLDILGTLCDILGIIDVTCQMFCCL